MGMGMGIDQDTSTSTGTGTSGTQHMGKSHYQMIIIMLHETIPYHTSD